VLFLKPKNVTVAHPVVNKEELVYITVRASTLRFFLPPHAYICDGQASSDYFASTAAEHFVRVIVISCKEFNSLPLKFFK
jgi:hypothetical protein